MRQMNYRELGNNYFTLNNCNALDLFATLTGIAI
jgi:hypothetical protein